MASSKVISSKIKLSQDDMQKGFVKLQHKDKVLPTSLKPEDIIVKINNKVYVVVNFGDNRTNEEIVKEWKEKYLR